MLDVRFRLVGDEDLGVGLDCRNCDRGGKPIAYYTGLTAYYENDPEVENVETITGLLAAADRHERVTHEEIVCASLL